MKITVSPSEPTHPTIMDGDLLIRKDKTGPPDVFLVLSRTVSINKIITVLLLNLNTLSDLVVPDYVVERDWKKFKGRVILEQE